jgi:hypothetical protein
MMNYLNDWLARKTARTQISIREKRSAGFKFTRALGPRGQFAVVYLLGEPAKEFAFVSIVNWPCPECDYTTAVLDGILDELFATDLGHIPARVKITLERIEWHDADSCAVAFYNAARGAMRDILGRDWCSDNVDYSDLT